ncbi:MAG: peroxiredoxin [Pseudomonadota bacterium]|nr:peroxiredoxin [Pseudomonadota bacterium]
MTIKPGDRIPSMTLKRWTDGAMREVTTDELFKGKVVFFGVPGAFTPTCSLKHLPGFVELGKEFQAKGVVRVVCMAVNDPFVLAAWFRQSGVNGAIEMLPDGNAELTEAIGLVMDGRGYGMGTRCQRFAMVVEDSVVKSLAVEKQGAFDVSSAQAVLEHML